MTKGQYEEWKRRLEGRLEDALARVEENPLMEHYAARNIHSYLQSLALLEKMGEGG